MYVRVCGEVMKTGYLRSYTNKQGTNVDVYRTTIDDGINNNMVVIEHSDDLKPSKGDLIDWQCWVRIVIPKDGRPFLALNGRQETRTLEPV